MKSEYLGIGVWLSWQEKIASNVGFPIDRINALHYGGIVNKVINLNKTGKYNTINELSSVSGVDSSIVRKILSEYVKYKQTGSVTVLKEIPSGFSRIVSNVGKGTGEIIKPILNPVLWPIAIIASIAGIIYLTNSKAKA